MICLMKIYMGETGPRCLFTLTDDALQIKKMGSPTSYATINSSDFSDFFLSMYVKLTNKKLTLR